MDVKERLRSFHLTTLEWFVVCFVAFDILITTVGHIPFFLSSDFAQLREANPVGMFFLSIGPLGFVVAGAVWAAFIVFLRRILPEPLGTLWIFFPLTLHIHGTLTWIIGWLRQLADCSYNIIMGLLPIFIAYLYFQRHPPERLRIQGFWHILGIILLVMVVLGYGFLTFGCVLPYTPDFLLGKLAGMLGIVP